MKRPILLLAAAVMLVGCGPTSARVGVSPPPGLLYKNVEGPMTARRGRPVIRPENPIIGKARFHGFSLNVPGVPGGSLFSVGIGDGSMEAAMADGGLSEVLWADYHELSILNGVYTRIEIRAYGDPDAPPATPSP